MEEQSDTVDDDGSFEIDPNVSNLDSREPPADLDEYTSYEDSDGHVICDRANAKAWIKSDVVTPLSR